MFVTTDRLYSLVFFFQAEDGIRDVAVTGVQTCALPICIHTVLTDNGMAFTGQERFRGGITDTCIGHIFERICKFNGVDKRHRSEEHTSELQSRLHIVCRLLLEKKTDSLWIPFREFRLKAGSRGFVSAAP